jgi:hypothetical protein
MRALLTLVVAAHAAAAPAPNVLPLRSARLYETGVGYYERSGPLAAGGVSLPVPAGHLDDALKTLVVLSKDGRVAGLEFGSSVSKGMARTLAGLPAAEGPITYPEVLGSLKGAPVQVQLAKETFAARIIDVVNEEVLLDAAAAHDGQPATAAKVTQELTLLLLTDRAELRRVRAKDLVAVRPTDPAVAGRLGSALDALSVRGAQARRSLRLLGTSSAVTLGYVAEAPLWRTTYRLVIDGSGKTLLQGWALLHNDTDEDWRRVKVELVNGRPDSFLFPLAAPRYARRQLVAPQNELSTVPQLIGTTVDAIWGDHLDEGVGGLGMTGSGAGGGGVGYGMGMGGISTRGSGGGTGSYSSGESASGLLDVGNLAGIAQAEGVEAGALFTYALADPLDLRAHGSALVPFVMQPIEAKEVTWIASVRDAPRTAVRFLNSTKQTLPGGPIAFFTGGGFSGESALDRLKPGEKRTVQYGADLDVELDSQVRSTHEEVKRLQFGGDQLTEHFLRSSELWYALENRSGRARLVWVGLDLQKNATVKGTEVDFDHESNRPVAVFQVPARERVERTLNAVEGVQRSTALAALDSPFLRQLAKLASLPEADRKALRDAAERRSELERADHDVAKANGGVAEAEGDLTRLRENLRALGGEKGAGAVAAENPFVQRVLAAEDKLAALRKQLQTFAAERPGRVDAVRAALAKLSP